MTETTHRPRPVVLCILDGWGHRDETEDNALALADIPTWDRLLRDNPHALIETSGDDVGLPRGQMGNSEVGHMNLGAGRVVVQDLPRIDSAVEDGSIQTNPALTGLIDRLKASGGTCHLMGLMSPGGVHSHQDHMAALAKAVGEAGVPVVVHALMDGRDTPPSSGKGYLETFLADVADVPGCRVGVVSGRYYGMDRDKRWDRVELAYNAMVDGDGVAEATDPVSGMQAAYDAGQTDEFVKPMVIDGYEGMRDGDGVLMANFRADRAREILAALLDPAFDGFARRRVVSFAGAAGLAEYSKAHNAWMETLFPPEALTGIFGEVVANAGLTQLRIAETEKYAHVTFFFNGGEETQFPGEERILVPSPKVATYDLQPEMSAPEVTDRLVEAIGSGKFDTVIVNFANGDMVGHSGILEAAMKAAVAVDGCLARLEEAVRAAGGVMLVTADHGNLEMMRDPQTGQPYTAHTVGKVDAILVNGPEGATLHDGRLADVSPTLLHLMGLPQPSEMTGQSLVDVQEARHGARAGALAD
ncbi:2,3-bisphosphoglycerate-independent phosphoglycerate mutase [Roseospira marina]|uniref:2,3-bisphosphoglycerate-independent phosphoglycerate mutase n=1 Tax=Roseospira marina TaxID=140057 RepID=A0A5M6IGT5_9PROT|nr:2,3-bisphosphoglycerate-independent phosphoglycerate mutase [Roseospira marina]KAA5607493.1 2,3-bisphosphoglycerate-independent phosphoglycerate mutase [Roseospira marina]MBB4312326.1 2,3-bisphosphoglycerate-independent phosphoglycerate mutase [Roseospira marina]MBB5085658.1 2,3-bisphosphoglycerate-independent phosphoglycerate mutase [Roseospira marina]